MTILLNCTSKVENLKNSPIRHRSFAYERIQALLYTEASSEYDEQRNICRLGMFSRNYIFMHVDCLFL